MRRAVFLDRDGVLVPDLGVSDPRCLPDPFPGVAAALGRLREGGWMTVVVTNQTGVARGLCRERDVTEAHAQLDRKLSEAGGGIDAFEVCFHHPEATDLAYRVGCDCRKPRPGLLLAAASRFDIDLAASFLVGDRPTDIEAGARAGCGTVQVRSGRSADRRIVTPDEPLDVAPDAVVDDLPAAVEWILARR